MGFKPKELKHYILALTHKSVIKNNSLNAYENNERLEYLGDAILDAVISELLYKRFPTADEGFLTQMRTKIVNGRKLTELAKEIGIKELIIIDKGTTLTGKIFEDAFEALIGAIFIDRGYKFVKKFITQKIMFQYINLNKLKHVDTNYKSQIIEWSQKNKKRVRFSTKYESVDSKYFVSIIHIDNLNYGQGKGISKKIAEQKAAQQAIKKIVR